MNLEKFTPLTVVRVLKNIDFDNSYTDVMDFDTVQAQTAFFQSKTKFTFTDLQPVRLQNKLRLPVVADNLYDCNYIMWQNANFSQKWFYAFITNVEFININMCEVTVEIDYMQTWWHDWVSLPCFVVREHTNNDTIGANIEEENIGYGDYVIMERDRFMPLDDSFYICVLKSYREETDGDFSGGLRAGIYNGMTLLVYKPDSEGISALNTLIKLLNEKNWQDDVISIFMCPLPLIAEPNTDRGFAFNKGITKQYTSIDGYVPKNNKLFCYPYNFLYVTNLQGNSGTYRYEFFNNPNNSSLCGFIGTGDCSPSGSIYIIPDYYKGVEYNYDEMLSLTGFPQCPWSSDSYKAWLAQNSSTVGMQALGSALGVGALLASGGGALAVAGGALTGIGSVLTSLDRAQAQPNQSKGNTSGNGAYIAGALNFDIYKKCITAEYARTIDDYFSLYGYASNKIKQPNIKGRASWNYVKTDGFKANGSVPFEDMAKIKQVFDRGVTFWHGDYVGDYSRSNGIV